MLTVIKLKNKVLKKPKGLVFVNVEEKSGSAFNPVKAINVGMAFTKGHSYKSPGEERRGKETRESE